MQNIYFKARSRSSGQKFPSFHKSLTPNLFWVCSIQSFLLQTSTSLSVSIPYICPPLPDGLPFGVSKFSDVRYKVHVIHRYHVRTKKERVTYSQRSEEKMKRSNIKNQQTGERKRDKNEQTRKQRKQATKGMKVGHENERKCMKGKREARNAGMTRKSREREIVLKKYRRGRNEEKGIPLYAMPGHSPHSQSAAIAGSPITVFHDANLCAITQYSFHVTLCAMLRCPSHLHFRAMTDHAITVSTSGTVRD